MNQWMVATHGDPLNSLRDLIRKVWTHYQLGRLLAPLNGKSENTGPGLITDVQDLDNISPFTPLMPVNAASLVPELVANANGGRAAVMLRPCELRTLRAMQIRGDLDTGNLITICVDCLGTLPADEFQWRAQRKGSPKGLAQEALQFARQGGIIPYRYRAACQICESPKAEGADINLGVIGLPVRQQMLVSTSIEIDPEPLGLPAPAPVDAELLDQHLRVVNRLVERGAQTRSRISNGLAAVLPADVNALIEQFSTCGNCTTCLDECPLCRSEMPQRDAEGRFAETEIVHWLVSCSGCGICEQSCPQHLPLTIIFGHIRAQLETMN